MEDQPAYMLALWRAASGATSASGPRGDTPVHAGGGNGAISVHLLRNPARDHLYGFLFMPSTHLFDHHGTVMSATQELS